MTTSRPLVVSTLAQASPVADAFSLVTTTVHGSHGRGACRHLAGHGCPPRARPLLRPVPAAAARTPATAREEAQILGTALRATSSLRRRGGALGLLAGGSGGRGSSGRVLRQRRNRGSSPICRRACASFNPAHWRACASSDPPRRPRSDAGESMGGEPACL
jgi:hypothetical protein